MVCEECDQRAINADGDTPWTGYPPEKPAEIDDTDVPPPDDGENPVFIDGHKCWRRYRFGGWVTFYDYYDCDTLREFYVQHGLMKPKKSRTHRISFNKQSASQSDSRRPAVDQRRGVAFTDALTDGSTQHTKQDMDRLRRLVLQAAEIDSEDLDPRKEIQQIAQQLEDDRLGPLAARYLEMLASDAPDDAVKALPAAARVYSAVAPETRQWLIYYFARLSRTQPESLLPVLDKLVDAVTEKDANLQLSALSTLGQIINNYPQTGAGVVDDLAKLLAHQHPTIRANAVGLLDHIASEYQHHVAVHIPSIATCLTDEDAAVRRNASIALVECGEAHPKAICEQIGQIEEALADDQPEVRKNTCVLIGNAQPAVSPERLQQLTNEMPDAEIRKLAQWAVDQTRF